MAAVDILMATYNGEPYIREQIESIQAQTFKDWSLFISDDCSTDGTLDTIRKISKTDRRIQVVAEKRRYGSAKRNFMSLLSQTESPYVMFCDQDDVWMPCKVERTLKAMKKSERAEGDIPILIFTDMKVVDHELRVISDSFESYSHLNPTRTKFHYLIAQSIGAGCTMMANSEALSLMVRDIDIESMVMHDWWLSLVCSAFGRIIYIDEPTSLYRQHGNNEVGAKRYSPLARVKQYDSMRNSVSRTARQASAFLSTYEKELKSEDLLCLTEYIKSCETDKIKSIKHLTKSRCWKQGLRKIGQIIVHFQGVNQ